MEIQWFPGHMKKTLESLKKSSSMVDFVLEMRDARIPESSENPMIKEIIPNKKLITILNKKDLSDEKINRMWVKKFTDEGGKIFLLSSTHRGELHALVDYLKTQRKGKILSNKIQLMVVGIPNVGKSTLINTFAKRKGLKAYDKPGVTKQTQWIRTEYDVNLLDTPGVLWHKFDDPVVGLHLALTNAIKDELLDIENLAIELIKIVRDLYPGLIYDKYLTDESEEPYNIIEELAKKRGMLLKGGLLNTEQASRKIITDFRSGKLGRISLERP